MDPMAGTKSTPSCAKVQHTVFKTSYLAKKWSLDRLSGGPDGYSGALRLKGTGGPGPFINHEAPSELISANFLCAETRLE